MTIAGQQHITRLRPRIRPGRTQSYSRVAQAVWLAVLVFVLYILANRVRATLHQGTLGPYEPAQTLATFQRQLLDEVDLDQLTADLLGIVDETMRPTHVSLWLR